MVTASFEAETNDATVSGGGKPPTQVPEIVILGVAGSNPVSHPSPFGSAGTITADIRRGEPLGEYHADNDYRNASRVKVFLDSPRRYWRQFLSPNPPPPTTNSGMELGSILHGWLELGDAFLASLVSPPESTLTATGLIGKEAKKWAAENVPSGSQLVSAADLAKVRACIDAIRANPAATRLMDRIVERECSVRWTHNGHKLRCRYDAVTSDGIVVDLKSTSDADIEADFPKSVLKWRYHFSEAWYRAGMAACGMAEQPLRYIVVSTTAHECCVVTLPWHVVAEGQRLMDAALTELQVREDLGWWLPDSHGEEVELTFPSYLTRGF